MRFGRLIGVAACIGCGCGDDMQRRAPALGRAPDLAILAHQGDDLLFVQPDLTDLAQRHGLTNVYVTAGDGRHTSDDESRAQYGGLLAAYAELTGFDRWQCGFTTLAGHSLEHCRLEDAALSLVFLGYPDGGERGERADSLLRLWNGDIESATTVSARPTRYSRDQLIDTLAAVIDASEPTTIRTLEIAGTHGDDHADHEITGALALLATAASARNPELIAYRGYATELEPPTLIEPLVARSRAALEAFEADIPARHDGWLRRRYAVGTRPFAGGALHAGDGSGLCLDASGDGSLRLADCAATRRIQLGPNGVLYLDQRCLQILPTGELVAGISCVTSASHRVVLDDEGHLWFGTPPLPGGRPAGAERARLFCLTVAGGRPRASECPATGAPTWELTDAPTDEPRPLGLSRTGRAVRLADIDGDQRADLCAVEARQLRCALGNGRGAFAAAEPIGTLDIEPESLVIGDVDADDRPDACGRHIDGLVCATAAAQHVAERWSAAFARAGPADAADRSLAAIDIDNDGADEICGLSSDGVVCAARSLTMLPDVLSRWPDRGAPLWPGDLDGDGRPDWCASSSGGLACGVAAHRAVSSDGVPWSFSLGATPEPAPASTAVGALGDIDSDGRADLCTVVDRRVLCARSLGRGFGPATVLGTLPPGEPPTGVWIGDLDANGSADVCADDGATIPCVFSR